MTLKRKLILSLLVLSCLGLVLPSTLLARNNNNDCPGNSCNAPGQQKRLSRGQSDFKGNLKTRQHIYYEGDPLLVSIKFSRGSELLADGTADAYVVVITPESTVLPFPVDANIGSADRTYFDFVIESMEALATGQYQLALVITVADGDPTNLADWYNGFRGMLDMEGVYISAEPLSEDADMDGECDYDSDGDGFCNGDEMQDDDDDVDDDGTTDDGTTDDGTTDDGTTDDGTTDDGTTDDGTTDDGTTDDGTTDDGTTDDGTTDDGQPV